MTLIKRIAAAATVAIALLAGGFAAGRIDITPTDPGACATVQWDHVDRDGTRQTPVDINKDGMIDCTSDRELGA